MDEKVDEYELVAKCIKRVYVGEDDFTSDSLDESKEWVEGLTNNQFEKIQSFFCLLYTSPSPRDAIPSRMPSSA